MIKQYQEKPLRDLTFAIVGLGLIGGSYAKALRNIKVRKILGMDISHGIARACLNANMIDETVEADGSNLKEADVIICSVYPEAIVGFVRQNVQNFAEGMLMTDATGVKGTMPHDIQALLPEGCEFISGHPMAGRQGSGLGMSDAAIFNNSNYIIVPTEKNSPEAVRWLEEFAKAPEAVRWLEEFAKALGCARSVKVSTEDHDKIIAYTSDLPHITAVALVNSASYNENTQYFIAGGFRDATRVADINPDLWSDLFLSNRANVIAEIENYQNQLERWKKAIENNDRETLKEIMREAGPRRRQLY